MEKLEKILKEINNENLYHILGIEKTESGEKVKKAYKKMIKIYHPDKNKDKNTVEIFSKIKKAYEILKSDDLKALYDGYMDRKEERAKKTQEFSAKRKGFIDDLKKREEEGNKSVKEKTKVNVNTFFNFPESETVVKKKTIQEKLDSTGIKIKWKGDGNIHVSKDMLYSYFSEYGSIEDVLIKDQENKAYILFITYKSVDAVLNDNKNSNLRKIFKIKKFTNKNKEYETAKLQYLDTNTLNAIKNFQTNDKLIKEKKLDFNNTQPYNNKLNEEINITDFEDLERIALEKLRNKLK
jgi:curved DNA-binding protein CbpA